MKEQINEVIEWIKNQPVRGCITGSCLLDYFEGQDIDVFLYDEKSFTKMIYTLIHNPMFTVNDPLEQWKLTSFIETENSKKMKLGVLTIKFLYNTCIEVNVILKKDCNNLPSTLLSFDLDLICKGYDIQTKQYLDLTNNSTETKIVDWNKWNTTYYSPELWNFSRVLRQLERCFKYHKRGYNTDKVVLKYIELIDNIIKYDSVFKSEEFNTKLELTKVNSKVVRDICTLWLENHEIDEEELKILREKLNEL